MHHFTLSDQDALIITEVQIDFLPGGRFAVARGDAVIPVLNRYIAIFRSKGCPVYAIRDWTPPGDRAPAPAGESGPRPVTPRCIAYSRGAQFPVSLQLPDDTVVISKTADEETQACSGFAGTALAALLRKCGTARVFVGGLTTDCSVRGTIDDALQEGFAAVVLLDAVRATEAQPGDGRRAIREMLARGALPCRLHNLQPPSTALPRDRLLHGPDLAKRRVQQRNRLPLPSRDSPRTE